MHVDRARLDSETVARLRVCSTISNLFNYLLLAGREVVPWGAARPAFLWFAEHLPPRRTAAIAPTRVPSELIFETQPRAPKSLAIR